MRPVLLLSFMVLPGLAGAQALNAIRLGDLPGTGRRWQYGEVTVAVPADRVQRWFADPAGWPSRFPDDAWARDLGRGSDGRRVAQFHSRALGRSLTVRLREQPGLITYDGAGKGISTQGRISFQPLGPSRTRVVLETSGELHGALGVIATEGMKRKRALRKLGADLDAVVKLSNAYAQGRRQAL